MPSFLGSGRSAYRVCAAEQYMVFRGSRALNRVSYFLIQQFEHALFLNWMKPSKSVKAGNGRAACVVPTDIFQTILKFMMVVSV